LRVISVDASQRIAEMEVTAEGGRKFLLRGLPVRWSLNVPDNLLVFEKKVGPDGVDRYTFYGKGWSHGVGMCQWLAQHQATNGWNDEAIVLTAFPGSKLVRAY